MTWPLAAVLVIIASTVPFVHANGTDRGRLMTAAALVVECALGFGALLLAVD